MKQQLTAIRQKKNAIRRPAVIAAIVAAKIMLHLTALYAAVAAQAAAKILFFGLADLL